MKFCITGALALLVMTLPVRAQEALYPPSSGEYIGEGIWRNEAPNHYYSSECCFCREASAARRSEAEPDATEYLVDGIWYSLPNNVLRMPKPGGKLVDFYMICDPVQRTYACVIPGVAG